MNLEVVEREEDTSDKVELADACLGEIEVQQEFELAVDVAKVVEADLVEQDALVGVGDEGDDWAMKLALIIHSEMIGVGIHVWKN